MIYSTCFGHLYVHHQELETILVLLPHMVCSALVAGGRRSSAGQQAMRPGWGKWVVNATPQPLYPREKPDTHCIGYWVGHKARLDESGKSRPPPPQGFDSRTVHPVASLFTDCVIPAGPKVFEPSYCCNANAAVVLWPQALRHRKSARSGNADIPRGSREPDSRPLWRRGWETSCEGAQADYRNQ